MAQVYQPLHPLSEEPPWSEGRKHLHPLSEEPPWSEGRKHFKASPGPTEAERYDFRPRGLGAAAPSGPGVKKLFLSKRCRYQQHEAGKNSSHGRVFLALCCDQICATLYVIGYVVSEMRPEKTPWSFSGLISRVVGAVFVFTGAAVPFSGVFFEAFFAWAFHLQISSSFSFAMISPLVFEIVITLPKLSFLRYPHFISSLIVSIASLIFSGLILTQLWVSFPTSHQLTIMF